MEEISFSKNLFWDSDPAKLDFIKNKSYIIERVVTRGDYHDWKKLFQLYSEIEIKESIVQIKHLDPKTFIFLSYYFDIPKTMFECYTTPSWTMPH